MSNSKKNKCNCKLCELDKIRSEALKSNDIEVVKKAVIKFSNLWLNVADDLSYHKCILDGSWPQAKEILTRSLEKTEKYQSKIINNVVK